MKPLNPFAALTRQIALKVLADERLKAHAEARLGKLLAAYEEMAHDPRYLPIRQELTLVLGDYLRDLVDRAQACKHCAPLANRIAMLQKVVAEPLEEVWFARQHEALEPEGEEPETLDESD